MNRRLRPVVAASTALVLAGAIGAGSVLAAPPASPSVPAAGTGAGPCAPLRISARAQPTIANLQAVGGCEIDRALAGLTNLGSVVDTSTTLTADHKSALGAIVTSSTSGLQALRTKIDGDSSVDALRQDIRSITADHRVGVLVARQVWLVKAADTVGATVSGFDTTAGQLQAAIDQAAASGKDVADARAHLASMNGQVADASKAVEGIAAAVLPLTPADWNAGRAAPILTAARSSVVDARTALRAALADARQVLVALR
jgi:hypothetical protein